MADRRSAWPPPSPPAVAARVRRRTSPDSGAKVGGKAGPIAITVADSQFSGRPSNLPLAEFKRQVETLSGGSMTVTILTNASPERQSAELRRTDHRQGQERHVRDGRRPGPRLVGGRRDQHERRCRRHCSCESDQHMAAIVNDAELAADLFSGLDAIGVTGLTLFPESLRHLFSFGDADPDNLATSKDGPIRAISSLETKAIDRGPRRNGCGSVRCRVPAGRR